MPSWNADARPATRWLLVEARTATERRRAGAAGRAWFTLARWADTDREIHPTSVPGQGDATDPGADRRAGRRRRRDLVGLPAARVACSAASGSGARPRCGWSARWPRRCRDDAPVDVSPGGAAWGVELAVPAYSQQLHRGEYLHWDRGGRSWCSPTSTSMVLAFHDRLPAPGDYAWVEPALPAAVRRAGRPARLRLRLRRRRQLGVQHRLRRRHGAEAFVTRLRSLTEAEAFIAAGIPLVATVVVHRGQPARRRLRAPTGHLLTVVGFTDDGDVICNDPASHEHRRATTRSAWSSTAAQFERAWLGSSGGVVYVVHPDDVPAAGADGPGRAELVSPSRSAGVNDTRVPAGGAVGHHVGARRGLGVAGPVGGPDRERVVARRDVDRAGPLHPGVVAGDPAELGLAPGVAVEAVLHLLDAGVLRPGVPADPDRRRPCTSAAVAGHLDPRLGLDRPLRPTSRGRSSRR